LSEFIVQISRQIQPLPLLIIDELGSELRLFAGCPVEVRGEFVEDLADGITIGQLRAQFAEAYEMARELSQPAAMVSTTAQAKLAGLWIERSEQTRKQPDEMSDAEIAAILRANAN
jgi:hypothetical protein